MELSERNMEVQDLMKFFDYTHLPEKLKEVSKPVCHLAYEMCWIISEDSEEFKIGLRKLLEAKDCFVRSAL